VDSIRPARVGLVVGQLSTGGAEGQLLQASRGLDRRQFEPVVYCLSTQVHPIGPLLQHEGVTLRVAPRPGMARVRWLAGQMTADRIDLVHAWLYIANALAWSATRLTRQRPLVTSARNCKVQSRVSQVANCLAFRGSRAIVANSHDVANYIVRHYRAPRDRIHVVYNGIDIERFCPGPQADQAAALIVTVGRLVGQKNHVLFLRAAAALAQQGVAVRFAIVGDGPLRATLEATARSLGIGERVEFLGERSDVESVLRGASQFWLTSRWEGMPNVVLEAMASGVPVLATDVGGVRELIRAGVDGFVLPPDDAMGFAHHAHALLANPPRLGEFKLAARARAEAFATPRMVAALARLYEGVLDQGS
jgi:glycosyltransferase involved in cell wall biosynthesis